MKSKITISSSNKQTTETIKQMQKQKKALQRAMAENKPLSSLKIKRVTKEHV